MTIEPYLNIYGEPDKYVGLPKIRGFYEDYLEFKDYIEIRVIDYKKIFNGKPIMFSRYANSYQVLNDFFYQFNSPRFNIYVGSNTRKIPGRKDSDIEYRRTFYFDIEHSGKKPPLSDKKYYKKLLNTVLYIRDCLKKEGLRINVIKETGRGMHIGVKINPLEAKIWEKKYKAWFKNFQKKYENERPEEEIKFSDSVFNISRIESAPGTKHYKYPEAPYRRVLFLECTPNDMEKVLMNVEEPVKKTIANTKALYRTRYTDETIYQCPEFLLLINNDDLPEGDLHTKIITQIKILVRDNNLDPEPISDKLRELGYDEVVDTPSSEYVYNPMVYNYWCLDNYEYCYDNKILLNTEIFKRKGPGISHYKNKEEPMFFPEDIVINDTRDAMDYIKKFNVNTKVNKNGVIHIFYDTLVKKIKELSTNKKIWKYMIELNPDYFNSIYYYSYPKNTH